MAGDSSTSPPATATASATATATSLAPGFRFHPTDEELVRYYLTRKVRGKTFRLDAVAEVDIYKSEPWDLPGLSRLTSRDMEWYFFGALDKKYGNGSRMNRATGKGYWKATGNDRPVRHDSRTIGMKKTLVFHKGRAPDGKRTDWVMHEYRLSDEELNKAGVVQDGYVLCKVFEKRGLGPPNGKQYAPFVEDDWDDDTSIFLPGSEPTDEALDVYDTTHNENQNALQPQVTAPPPLSQNEDVQFVCKRERQDDCPLPTIYDPEPFQRNKKIREDIDLNRSRSSNVIDPCSSIRKTSDENPSIPARRFDIATFDLSVHPSYLELIDKLQKEIHNISNERETLKMEVMSAQAMITILQSRLEIISKENRNLKRLTREDVM